MEIANGRAVEYESWNHTPSKLSLQPDTPAIINSVNNNYFWNQQILLWRNWAVFLMIGRLTITDWISGFILTCSVFAMDVSTFVVNHMGICQADGQYDLRKYLLSH